MIQENLEKIRATLPQGVQLVAVSKLKPVEDIQEAYQAGQRAFGENYATELRDKAALLPRDVEWHFIGHLQGKQLKYYIPFVSLIHGVDSVEHLLEVEKAAEKANRTVDVLLQVHVAKEETKFGFSPKELEQLEKLGELENLPITSLPHTRVCGVMGMASNTDDTTRVRADFHAIRGIYEQLRAGLFAGQDQFRVVSMGMSHDYPIAIDEGSTLVRIGSAIFGERIKLKAEK